MATRKAKRPDGSRARRPGSGRGKTSRKAKGGAGKLPKSAVTLVVTLRAREGQELLLEAELRALIAPTRREEGCIRYDLFRSLDAPNAFLLHEVWESREHHTEHMRTDHFLRWNARKDALLASREAGFWTQVA
jgi:quinol monooxygenase YgiN